MVGGSRNAGACAGAAGSCLVSPDASCVDISVGRNAGRDRSGAGGRSNGFKLALALGDGRWR
eukprot:975158-Rhodomonas_salina.4